MGKVKVNVQPHADQATIVSDMVSAAQQASGKSANAAEPIRDANGKVTSVLVNLPDSDATGLANAAEKINENPGVSKALVYPVCEEEDFESYSDSDAITKLFGEDISADHPSNPIPGTVQAIKASTASALSGSLGMELTHTNPNSNQLAGFDFVWPMSAIGAAPNAEIVSLEGKVKFNEPVAGYSEGYSNTMNVQLFPFSRFIGLRVSDRNANSNWHLVVETLSGRQTVDTGIAFDATVDFKFEGNSLTDQLVATLNGTTTVYSMAMTSSAPFCDIHTSMRRRNSTSDSKTLASVYMDDLKYCVLA